MEFGSTQLSLVSVRAEPSHAAEIVTQNLFGEIYTAEERSGNWMRICMQHDKYSGWIHEKQHTTLTEPQYRKLEKSERAFTAESVQSISGSESTFPILIGSTIYDFDGINCRAGKEKYHFSGKAVRESREYLSAEYVRKFALKFLHAPYLWGGRSPFGIDCSGLVQVVFKICSLDIPRDAWQQSEVGKTINFVHEAKEGDVAFFDNEEGKITHAGIILSDLAIIHASGRVRIDQLDHYGIFNKEMKKYSHKLRIIRRFL